MYIPRKPLPGLNFIVFLPEAAVVAAFSDAIIFYQQLRKRIAG